jgi:hypothetical protein
MAAALAPTGKFRKSALVVPAALDEKNLSLWAAPESGGTRQNRAKAQTAVKAAVLIIPARKYLKPFIKSFLLSTP